MQDAEVKTLQRNLISKGYQPGAVDGNFGPKTLHCLLACAASVRQSDALKVHAEALAPAMLRAGIIGRFRISHFLANAAHETRGFTKLRESTSYSDAAHLDATYSRVKGYSDALALIRAGSVAIANRVYADQLGNGNEASGDGDRYRGRGYLMHTFRDNYAEVGKLIGRDLVTAPQWLETPDIAASAACAYWNARTLSVAADRNDPITIRRIINGPARLGLDDCTRVANRLIALWI
ncbi:hypothetical protein MMA231_02485 [Asticcacaulis sp. MM231]|uniref:peptidoglycan-binding protein n=1 Tax=Asticcacaulis sp. MM231 TaxID=3157666 RepID=UPI0032D5956F